MDVCETQEALLKHPAVEIPRPPLLPAEKNNGTTRRSRTREVSSKYRSPTPSASSGPRRCPSPSITRTTPSVSVPKRAISVERKRPSTPPSPPSPSTPVHDTATDMLLASRKTIGGRLPEALWPSTMRSLSVSFQTDAFSLPISKREKPVTHSLPDRTLRPSSNVAHKRAETPPVSRKSTPERKRSPLKGKNVTNQSENSKPVDGLPTRLLDQHRWPSRTSVKASSNSLNRSVDLTGKTSKTSTVPHLALGTPSLRRMSLPGVQKSTSDTLRLLSSVGERGKTEFETRSVDNSLQRPKLFSSSSLERAASVTSAVRSQSLPTPGSCPPSPINTTVLPSSISRGVSPSRTKVSNPPPSRGSSPSRTKFSNPPPSRGSSPSRIRPSSPTGQSNSSTSVLSFIADIRKGKKGANHIEEVHQLRLLYNRHLQWRYVNACADAELYSQKITAEKTLYNVWRTTSDLRDSVTEKRTDLQQLRLKLKFYTVLNEQMAYLDEWALTERDYTSSLAEAIEGLQASTLRLPVSGARTDIENMKAATCSAVDVLQAMGSSICSILPKVEGTNCLVSELADVAAQERAMLDQCEALLASTAALQVEEYSLRTHLIQLQEAWKYGMLPVFGN